MRGREKDQLKSRDERGRKKRGGAWGWSRNEDQGQPKRERDGMSESGRGDLAGQGIDLRAPGSNTGETALIQATAEPTYILHCRVL